MEAYADVATIFAVASVDITDADGVGMLEGTSAADWFV